MAMKGQELEQRLLAACNRLRDPVDEYKVHIFALLFLKRIYVYWDREYVPC